MLFAMKTKYKMITLNILLHIFFLSNREEVLKVVKLTSGGFELGPILTGKSF